MSYIDGFVVPVPKGQKERYQQFAARSAPFFWNMARCVWLNAGAMMSRWGR